MNCSSCTEPCLNDWCSTKDSEMECKECDDLASTVDKLTTRIRFLNQERNIDAELITNMEKEIEMLEYEVSKLRIQVEVYRRYSDKDVVRALADET